MPTEYRASSAALCNAPDASSVLEAERRVVDAGASYTASVSFMQAESSLFNRDPEMATSGQCMINLHHPSSVQWS